MRRANHAGANDHRRGQPGPAQVLEGPNSAVSRPRNFGVTGTSLWFTFVFGSPNKLMVLL